MNYTTPLAFRLRPNNLDEVIGQKHLLGEDGFLRQSVKSHTLFSLIFFGPPGCGKTTIAEAYAKSMDVKYILLNAVTSNKKDLEEAIKECLLFNESIIIMDEVHRMNKDKQDLLLPYLENGSIYLIGCTTSNPYISINQAIRSRVHLLEVSKLNEGDIKEGIIRALKSPKGMNNKFTLEEDALNYLASSSSGDMRFALNYIQVLSMYNKKTFNINDIKNIVKVPNYSFDKNEDSHYNLVSALQKSIRGSDVNASLYYLARICVNEDLDSIERRLLITAYEDVGLANPYAVDRVYNAIETAKKVGFPEAIIPLGFAVCDLALSPKSKYATLAIEEAYEEAKKYPLDVLDYLKYTRVNVSEEDAYPYDRSDLWEKMQYLPEIIKDIEFYKPLGKSKYEKALNDNYLRLKNNKRSSDLRKLKSK